MNIGNFLLVFSAPSMLSDIGHHGLKINYCCLSQTYYRRSLLWLCLSQSRGLLYFAGSYAMPDDVGYGSKLRLMPLWLPALARCC